MGDAGTVTAPGNDVTKPIVVMTSFPLFGHVAASLQLSDYLVSRGFTVYNIVGHEFAAPAKRGGAICIEDPYDTNAAFAQNADKTGLDALICHTMNLFLDHTAEAHQLLRETLETVKQRYGPSREIVIWHEAMACSLLPFLYGAPLPKGYDALPRVINYHSTINFDRSVDVFPCGMGMPMVSSEEERRACEAAWDGFDAAAKRVEGHVNVVHAEIGAVQPFRGNLWSRFMTLGEATVFLYSKSVEFPRSDLRFNALYVGTFPREPQEEMQDAPEWWPEIEANSALPAGSPAKQKVVFLTQGTLHNEATHLLMPTMTALAARTDLLVVAALGRKGLTLPSGFAVPPNARVADYVPYEDILQHADVFVSNAGFGATLHAICAGVPMVLAGTEIDKADNSRRMARTGMAIDLATQDPSGEAIVGAVDRILGEAKWKERAMEMRRENEELDGLGNVEKLILGQRIDKNLCF